MSEDLVVWVSFQVVRQGVAQVANLEHTVPAELSGFGLVEALRDEVKRATGSETMVLRHWQPLRRTTGGRRVTTTYLVSYQDESRVIAGVGVRQYYQKLGYRLEGTYMTKFLKDESDNG